MSIGAIGTSGVQYVGKVAAASTSTASTSLEETKSSDRSAVSGPAAMLNKLKSLQASDPEKFKEVTSKISDDLSKAAESSSDEREKKMLTEMAQKFQTASQTGDVSGLAPPQKPSGPPPGGPPPGGGGGGKAGGVSSAKGASDTSSTKSSDSTDPADTNADGTVSETERKAYEAKKSAMSNAASAYQKQSNSASRAKMDGFMSRVSNIIDADLSA